MLYEHAVAKGAAQRKDIEDHDAARSKIKREEAKNLWMTLLDQLPAEKDNICRCDSEKGCDGSCGARNSIEMVLQSSGSFSSTSKKSVVDETLFQGFDDFMTRDEKVFLTDLFTSGDVRSLVQAALSMHGVRRLGMSGKHLAVRKEQEPLMCKTTLISSSKQNCSSRCQTTCRDTFCNPAYSYQMAA